MERQREDFIHQTTETKETRKGGARKKRNKRRKTKSIIALNKSKWHNLFY